MCDELQKLKDLRSAAWKFQQDLDSWLECPFLREATNQAVESKKRLDDLFLDFYRAVRAAA